LLEIGSRFKLIIGLFLLTSLILLGYNGFRFMVLYDNPLIGISSESKLARIKWNRLETLIGKEKNRSWGKSIETMIKREEENEVKFEEIIPVPNVTAVVEKDTEILPNISGIIKTSDSNGKSSSAVIVDGKIYYENENVAGFTIEEITEKGVSLIKGGKSFFIDAPTSPYSMDRGE
jgi:hypothetical protein